MSVIGIFDTTKDDALLAAVSKISEMTLYILRSLAHYYYFVYIHVFVSLINYDY